MSSSPLQPVGLARAARIVGAWCAMLALLGGAAGAVRGEETDLRRLANAARESARAGAVDARERVEDLWRRIEAVPSDDPDRRALVLHVLRTRMVLPARSRDQEQEREQALLDRDLASFVGEATEANDAWALAWALLYRAELALARSDPAGANVLLDRALRVPETDSTFAARIEAERLRERAFLANDPEESLRALERMRATLLRMRPRIGDIEYSNRARPVHERIASRLLERAARTGPTGPGGSDAGEATLRLALERLEELRLAELRAHFGEACLADLVTTTPERHERTLLLYPVLLEDRVELIVGRDGRLARLASPLSPDELVDAARRLRGALQDPTSSRHRQFAARLRTALIEPVEAWLGRPLSELDRGEATLVYVPSGPLRAVPIAALYDPRRGRHLVEDIALSTQPSLHVLPSSPLEPARTRLLAAGLSEAVDGFSALPFAERELAAVASRFDASLRLDRGFTKQSFAEALESEPFDVVHVASHGRFDPRASESFLLAWDGRIRLDDLARSVASTRHRAGRPLELLVLSACETAIGDERAALGLAGIAIQSGARSAVASLWKVHDEATMQLFERFYRELARPGVGRAEVLRRAQRSLLEQDRFRHPVYWSAFLLVSGWR